MNEFLRKIGIIEDPFIKEVNCAYAATIIKTIEKAKGAKGLDALFQQLFKNHLLIDWSRTKLEECLRDEHFWINSFLSKAIFEIGKELTGDINFY